MADLPTLTVALPTCNGSGHLAETLRSILAQEAAVFELLVCDDRSDDDTLAIVRAEAGDRARVVVNSERLGLAGNWNRCVELSGTAWVAVFHQDDLMYPDHLAAHARTIAADPTLGLICGAADVVDASGEAVPPSVVGRDDPGTADRVYPPGGFVVELAVRNPVRCSAVTLNRSAHARVGGFDRTYRYAVDWDFWLRVSRLWPVAWLARPTVAVRWHAGSETHRFKAGTSDLDEQARLLHWLHFVEGRNLPDAPRLRRAADRRLSRAYLNRAYDAARAGDRDLVRDCLRRALALWPGIVSRIALDPRLLARLLAVAIAPGRRGVDPD